MSIVDVLDRHRVPYVLDSHHHVRSGWVGIDCPTCSPHSGRYRLGLQISTGRANCWNCGGQNGVWVLATVCGIQFAEAEEIIGEGVGIIPERVHTGRLVLPKGRAVLQPAHIKYMQARGFSPAEIVRLWTVEGIGLSSRLKWRLFIPIRDRGGRVVSWTTRSISATSKQRYISASSEEEAVPHKSILYGAELARNAVVCVEGPLDAWSVGPGAVATCGVGYSQDQLAELSQYPVRIVCFDASVDAQFRARGLAKQLSLFPGTTENVLLETGDDPAEADPGEIAELRGAFLDFTR